MFLEKFLSGSLLKLYEIRNVLMLCCRNTGSLEIVPWEMEKGKQLKPRIQSDMRSLEMHCINLLVREPWRMSRNAT